MPVPRCAALKEQKSYAFSIKDFISRIREFENFLSFELLKNLRIFASRHCCP